MYWAFVKIFSIKSGNVICVFIQKCMEISKSDRHGPVNYFEKQLIKLEKT